MPFIIQKTASVRVVASQAGAGGGRPRGRPRKKADREPKEDPPKPVFLHWPGPKEVSMAELREAYTACHRLQGGERDACYLVHGLDAAAMERYFPVVEMFETCFLGVPTVPRNVLRGPPKHRSQPRPWHLPGTTPPTPPDADPK